MYERTPTGAWVKRSTTGRVAAWGIPAGAVSRVRETDRVFGGNREGEMLCAGYGRDFHVTNHCKETKVAAGRNVAERKQLQ